jgi:Protein of unknown function (DUF4236)
MGWNLRRSKKIGIFRVNLSKSGVGISAGVKGLRVGRDAKGRSYTALSIPGTGLYKRTYSKSGNRSVTGPRQSSQLSHQSGSNSIAGFCLVGAVTTFLLGHWFLGILLIAFACFVAAAANQRPKEKTNSISTEPGARDLRNVGNIPQETLDFLESKKRR